MDYCLLIPSQSRVLRRGEQLLLTFFDRGSCQLKLFWATLTLQGPECIDPTFSRSRIKRRDQREKVASSNRMPRFWIRAYSGRFFTVGFFQRTGLCRGDFSFSKF